MTQATRSLSEAARMNIRAKEASRQLNRRKEVLRVIMKQNRCNTNRAIEIFKDQCIAKLGHVPDEVMTDLQVIREEMAYEDATA